MEQKMASSMAKRTTALLVLSFFFTAAFSQEIEEIIVVAQKREQPAQDVGIAITAFTGETIRNLRTYTSEDIANQTPNLQSASFSADPTVMLFAIRGVGQNDFGDHHEGPTAIYVDEAYVSSLGATGFQLFDIERVEVLRGPQGTLFGRNATGGLVHYFTVKPGDDFDAFAEASYGEYNQQRLEGAIGGGLGSQARARLSVLSSQNDGYLENRIGPDVHETDAFAARLQFEVDISQSADVWLKLYTAEDNNPDVGGFTHRAALPGPDGLGDFLASDVNADLWGLGSCPGCDVLGYRDDDGDPWAGEFDQPGKFNRDGTGGTLRITADMPVFTFTALTDWSELEKSYGEDSDGSPNPLYLFESTQDSSQWSQEVRFNGERERFIWTAGAYYLNIDGDYSSRFASPLFDADQLNLFDLKTTSWAVFGQVEYELAANWRLIAGARWTEDEKDYSYDPQCSGTGCIGFFVFPGSGAVSDIGGFNSNTVGSLASQSDSDTAGKLQVEWQNDSVLVYGGVSRGFKAGGFNAPIDGLLLPEEMVYAGEKLTSYEVGFKSSFAGNAVRLNGAAFYYDYDDKQAFTFAGISSSLVNRNSEASGFELELTARPGPGWDIAIGLATLDATVDDVPLPSGISAKQEAAQAPDLTLNGMVRKTWELAGGTLSLTIDGSYVGEQYFNTINHRTSRSEAYSLFNGELGYSGANDRWSAGVFMNNMTDEDAVTYAIDVSGSGYALQSHVRPRWTGVRFRYSWE
jgi:iron complex outermembrane receptor protein